jgi:CHAT domain-containing protein
VPRSENRWDAFTKEQETFLAPESGWQRGVHDLLMAPFEDLLMQGGVKHLVVMADLALTLIPLHLLPNAAGVTLGERFRVSYCPAYSLIPDALSRIQDSNGAQSVLIVADPSKTLRFVRWEQTMIASLFPPGNVRVMDATNASKDSLAAAVRDVDVVHFATHGRFDSEDVERSGVALQSGEWLTIDEMRKLKFKDGALVFLSACETARLKLAGRSTPLGIVPALFEAGASTVIATFWKVNDLSTALVAARFYDNWLVRKQTRIDSLIEAMRWVQTITADQVIEISREPTDIRGVRSLQTALAGLKQLFKRPVEPIASPFATPFFWGPFALYGAWH